MSSPDQRPPSTGRSPSPANLPFANDPARSEAELERALAEVPAYAGWRGADPGRGASIDARYAALPATNRDVMVAQAPRGFVPATADLEAALATGAAELVRTSGTTGPQVTLAWSQAWWDACERASCALHAELAAYGAGAPAAVVASPRCVGPGERDPPRPISERTLGRLLFPNEHADVARWTDDAVRRMVDELVAYAPALIEAEPAYLAALCARAEALGLTLPRPRLVTLTYTVASRLERARIARGFGSPVASAYGSTETGTTMIECERGRLHHNAAWCRIELVPLRDQPAVGRLLVTPFGHPLACYLRFEVGDLARVATTPCPCGRAGGAVERIEGRVQEATLGRDGRVITFAALDDAIAVVPTSERVISYQLEQDATGVRLRATATGAVDTERLSAALRGLYGDDVSVAVVSALAPQPSGKYARVHQRLAIDPAWVAAG